MATGVPADRHDKVMHGSVTFGDQVLMGGDVAPDRYEAPKGFSLSLQIRDTADAERIFRELGDGGQIVVPLAQTVWAARFGMVVDRFGIPWLINCEGAEPAHGLMRPSLSPQAWPWCRYSSPWVAPFRSSVGC